MKSNYSQMSWSEPPWIETSGHELLMSKDIHHPLKSVLDAVPLRPARYRHRRTNAMIWEELVSLVKVELAPPDRLTSIHTSGDRIPSGVFVVSSASVKRSCDHYDALPDKPIPSPKCISQFNDIIATDMARLPWLNLDFEDGEETSSLECSDDEL